METSKEILKQEAERLATLEMRFRLLEEEERRLSEGLAAAKRGGKLPDGRNAKEIKVQLGKVQDEAASLRRQVRLQAEKCCSVRSQIQEVKEQECWWDIPLEQVLKDGYTLPGGMFLESGLLYTELDAAGYHMEQSKDTSNVVRLLEFYGEREKGFIPLYFSKKKFRACVGKPLKRRVIYNVSVVSGVYRFTAEINHEANPAVRLWERYRERESYLRGQMQEDVEAYNQKIDDWERIANLSFFTNEERFLMGQMDTQDYYSQNVWRELGVQDKKEKYLKQLEADRYHAERAVMEANKSYTASWRAASEESDILRLMPVGEVVYGDGELLALLLYCGEQKVTEYQFQGNVNLDELEGVIVREKVLFCKNSISPELLTHLIYTYGSFLPAYQVLKPRPKRCPDEVWRAWAELRWSYLSLECGGSM